MKSRLRSTDRRTDMIRFGFIQNSQNLKKQTKKKNMDSGEQDSSEEGQTGAYWKDENLNQEKYSEDEEEGDGS